MKSASRMLLILWLIFARAADAGAIDKSTMVKGKQAKSESRQIISDAGLRYCEALVQMALPKKQDFSTTGIALIQDGLQKLKNDPALSEMAAHASLTQALCAQTGYQVLREDLVALDRQLGESKYVNAILRSLAKSHLDVREVPPIHLATIKSLDHLFGASPRAPFSLKVFRGGKVFPESQSLKRGDRLEFPAFVSTTLDVEVAKNFALGCGYAACDPNEAQFPSDEGAQIFELSLSQKAKMLPIYLFAFLRRLGLPQFQLMTSTKVFEEAEILLPRGTVMEIVSVVTESIDGYNYNWVKASIVPVAD